MKKHDDGQLWMHTGDIGILDEEGFLKGNVLHSWMWRKSAHKSIEVVGRSKDIIIRGGEVGDFYLHLISALTLMTASFVQNLFPVQIENRLICHRGIREAAAVAIPDKTYGEVVGVFIVREGREWDGAPGADQASSGHAKLGRSEVRGWVAEGMNPQVCLPFDVWETMDLNSSPECARVGVVYGRGWIAHRASKDC